MNEQQDYQQPIQPTEDQARLADMQENATTTPVTDMQSQQERVRFEQHVQNQGTQIPENFKTAGDWFDSLKSAQGQYTQARQEIADLKRTYNEQGTENPNYREPVQEQQQAPMRPQTDEELRLNLQRDLPDPNIAPSNVTAQMWHAWGQELSVMGDLSENTRAGIREVTGYPDEVIDTFIDGQKSQRREAYSTAAEGVGGDDKLEQIFNWAETNLSKEDQAHINMGLAGSSYEVTLRGLESMYNNRPIATEQAQEPMSNANMGQVAATDTGYMGYKTKREFTADRNNPRFKLEPAYRQAVEQRMQRTDFNSLPA